MAYASATNENISAYNICYQAPLFPLNTLLAKRERKIEARDRAKRLDHPLEDTVREQRLGATSDQPKSAIDGI